MRRGSHVVSACLLVTAFACSPAREEDPVPVPKPKDAGVVDAGNVDSGSTDAGTPEDAGFVDAGEPDAGVVDSGFVAGPEMSDQACSDHFDNDLDNRADCLDRDCLLTYDVTVCGTPAPVLVTVEDLQHVPQLPAHPQSTDATDPLKVSKVRVERVVVTSPTFTTSGSPSFFVADPSATNGAPAAPWHGIFVFANGLTTSVTPGDELDLFGTYEEFFGSSQIELDRYSLHGRASAAPSPADVDVATLTNSATVEQWEGVLVRVRDVVVTDIDQPSGSTVTPNDDFLIGAVGSTAKLDVSNLMLPVDGPRHPAVGARFQSVTGLLTFTFGRYRLLLRSAADAVEQPLADLDGDGKGDDVDNCPTVSNVNQADSDADQIGDVCDNCPAVLNHDQLDSDGDARGNLCDNCPTVVNPDQADTDLDGIGDACEAISADKDGDTIPDDRDNCIDVVNPDQKNSDTDPRGDACDNCPLLATNDVSDTDTDGLGNACDNCPSNQNVNQADSNSNGIGNVCEPPAGTRAPAAGEIVFNEVLAIPPGSLVTDLQGDTNLDGVRDGRQDEFVEIVNRASVALQLDGVKVLRSAATWPTVPPGANELRFTFPKNTLLAPGKAMVLFSGIQPRKTLSLSYGGSVGISLSNAAPVSGALELGGTSFLRLVRDLVILDEVAYSPTIPTPAGAQPFDLNVIKVSMTRSPDVTGTVWVKHTDAAPGVVMSVGTKANGTAF